MEPVSSLFLQQLGANGVYGPEDAKRLCKVMIDMYDMSRHYKEAVQNIKSKVSRVNKTSRVALSNNECDNTILLEDHSAKVEISKMKNELKELSSENEELKKILFGVDSVRMSFKDCCAELFGPDCKSISSFSELKDRLVSLKSTDIGRSVSPSSSEMDLSEVVKLQKEVH